jgi:DNA-binding CsgD family transcriptional regulator
MYAALMPITELPWSTGWPLAFRSSLLPLLVEALIGTQRLDQAAEVLDELHGCAQVTPSLVIVTESLRGWLARERGDTTSARSVLEAAVALPDGENDVALHRGLLEQSFGDLLLTLHERRATIHWIRKAHDRFAALGALPFRDRCAARLADCGVRPPEQAADQILVLTSRERDVARLVARGATNQQAAGQLYVSVKTVEYHLRNIYTKLGISSRSQLAALFPSAAA